MRTSITHVRVAAVAGVVALVGAAGLVTAPPAVAHDELTGSAPSAGATVDQRPARVTLYFEEPPDPAPIRVTVTGPDGRAVTAGGPRLAGSIVSAALAPARSAGAGAYVIAYRIVSDDGHPVAGTIRFSVAASARASRATAASSAATRPRSGWTGLAIGASVVVLAAGLAAAWAQRRRRVELPPPAARVPDRVPI